ncbi:MAG: hypothetical protein KHZ05_11660 [Oscillospiraceae bacterium]|nr:hypothetical protein [Oscillospiraceae bacterium]
MSRAPRVILAEWMADAIYDRIIYNAYTIQIEGKSMRKKNSEAPLPLPSISLCSIIWRARR